MGIASSPKCDVIPAQAGTHPEMLPCTMAPTTTLRLGPDLEMGPGLRRGDTVGGASAVLEPKRLMI